MIEADVRNASAARGSASAGATQRDTFDRKPEIHQPA